LLFSKKADAPLNNNEALCLSCTLAEHHEKATAKERTPMSEMKYARPNPG